MAAPNPGMAIAQSSMDLLDTIIGGAFDIATLNKEQQLEYQKFLADTFPEYKEFFKFENRTDYRNVYIIVAMVFILIVLVLAITVGDRKES